MKENLNIMLIDDSYSDNLLNKMELERSGLDIGNILEFVYAEDALKFLKTPSRASVDIILLDVNMPRMNGFEFLDEYASLYQELKANTVVIMLTTSLNPSDRKKAEANPDVNGFISKPLEIENLLTIIEKSML